MAKIELPEYVQQIGAVYSGIAEQVEKLIFWLNDVNPEGKDKKHVTAMTKRVNDFLKALEKSVGIEYSLAATSPVKNKARFLSSVKTELEKIRQLESYVALAATRPTHEVITTINRLYQEIKKEIAAQEEMVKR
jgi:predicted DNA-binding transcriptional regulator